MMNVLKKLLAAAAAITIWATIQPGTLSAQTSGSGGDGNTRLLWRGTDSSISLWKLDPSLKVVTSHLYGPYDGWLPLAITTAKNNNTVVLWRYTDGGVLLWLVDSNLNYVTSKYYGPFNGWLAESVSVDTNGNNTFRLVWRETDGRVDVYFLDSALNYVTSGIYGPFFGYDPGNAAAARKPAASGPADTKAAAAMGTKANVTNPVPK